MVYSMSWLTIESNPMSKHGFPNDDPLFPTQAMLGTAGFAWADAVAGMAVPPTFPQASRVKPNLPMPRAQIRPIRAKRSVSRVR